MKKTIMLLKKIGLGRVRKDEEGIRKPASAGQTGAAPATVRGEGPAEMPLGREPREGAQAPATRKPGDLPAQEP